MQFWGFARTWATFVYRTLYLHTLRHLIQVYALLDVGTQELEGKTHWEVSVIGGFLSRAGTVSFTVQYFRVQVKLSQPLDTRKRATLEDLELELGNIQTRIHGAGTLDYLVEASVNILPNLLR